MQEKTFGKYILTERLGGGGMAEVFRARLEGPEGFSKDLALKLILPHFSDEPEFVRMFIHEATLAARLDHAAIVRIHEFDQVDGTYYIAMELVNGRDLRAILARAREIDRPVRLAEAIQIGLEVCKGLAFAHGELNPEGPCVIHRDISPHNILVSQAGEVKITDFGIAKTASAASITRTGVIKGKVSYMSPEQARGEKVDERSDLFSLGCVLWELLCGQRLFGGENDLVVIEKLQKGVVQPPSQYNPEVTARVDEVLLELLAREPARRYQSAGAVARDLDRILVESGIDRASLLSDLYRDLFWVTEVNTGMLMVDSETPVSVESVAKNQVIPVGPDAATRLERPQPDMPPGLPGKKKKDRVHRFWIRLWVIMAVPVIVLWVVWSGIDFGKEPDKVTPGDHVPPVPPKEVQVEGVVESGIPEAPTPEAPKDSTEKTDSVAEGEKLVDKKEELMPGDKKAFGRLDLNAIPWAKVYLGKRFLGDTPLERVRLPVGEHRLRLVNKKLGVTKIIRVRIRPNRISQQVIDLKSAKQVQTKTEQ